MTEECQKIFPLSYISVKYLLVLLVLIHIFFESHFFIFHDEMRI